MIKIQEKLPKDLKMKSTSTDREIAQKVAKVLFESGCVLLRTQIPFRFTSGLLSPIYVDNRRLISLPKARKIILKYLIVQIGKIGMHDVIAGCATAGIPWAAWIAEELSLPMVYVRSKPKGHGQGNQVEGIIKRGQKVLVVEDMVSTAETSKEIVLALRKLGAEVAHEIAIYSHNLRVARDNFRKLRVKFMPLTALSQVVATARKEGYLRPDDQELMILEWAKDPKNWGKRQGFE